MCRLSESENGLPCSIDRTMSSKSVLVTGAAGFIGSHLTERCLQLGCRVVAVDALTDTYSDSLKRANLVDSLENANCTFIEADLLAIDLPSLLGGVEIVFHLAAQPGVPQSWDEFDVYVSRNVLATHGLLDAARDVSLERFVLASSSSVYGDAATLPTREEAVPQPVSPYGVTKVATEQLARAYWRGFAVPTVALRYFTVYGPRQRPDMAFNRLIASALSGEVFEVFGDGTQTRDCTFVTDVVNATIASAQYGQPGLAYNIAGGSRRSLNSVVEVLSELTRSEVSCQYTGRRPGDARDTAADISRAHRDLGFEPSVPLEVGLQAQLEWQRNVPARRPQD